MPSNADSALFGTNITDYWFPVSQGGDIAFIYGVVKILVERDWLNDDFIAKHTVDFAALNSKLETLHFPDLEQASGLTHADMEEFAALLRDAKNAVFVWSMGITQHTHGGDGVSMILNLGLARGYVGRDKNGLMPIRGHSSVQGGAEMGAYATAFPGGKTINAENAAWLTREYGFPVPSENGLDAVEMVEACARGELDLLYCLGGNFLRTLPDPGYVAKAMANVPLRVHQDIILTDQMLIEARGDVLLLPAKTRYEQDDGGTETTTERRVIFSPEIPRQIGEANAEWKILHELAAAAYPERAHLLGCETGQGMREEIARVVPFYDGVQHLKKSGDQFQYGGPHLCADGTFQTSDGKAHFRIVELPITVGRVAGPYHDIADKCAQHIADTRAWPRSVGERSEPERSGRARVSAMAPIPRHPDPASLLFVPLADQDGPKVDAPFASPHRLQSHVIPHKRLADKPPNSAPVYFPIPFHPTSGPAGRILPPVYPLGQPPRVALEHLRGPLHADPFVRSTLVVITQPPITAPLLGQPGALRFAGHFRLVNTVKLLMRSVLTRASRGDKLHLHPQFHPPRAQARQPRCPNRAKGRAIVAANPPGQSMAQKQTPERPLRGPDGGRAQQHNPQAIPAVQIPHGQRLHTGAIAGAIPALKIHGPDVMATHGSAHGPAPHLRPRQASAPPAAQTPTFKPAADGRGRRSAPVAKPTDQLMPQFTGTPSRPAAAKPPHPAHPLGTGLDRQRQRSARLVPEPAEPMEPEAFAPLVRGLPRDPETSAQLADRKLAGDHLPHQIKPLFNFTFNFPRHTPRKVSAMS